MRLTAKLLVLISMLLATAACGKQGVANKTQRLASVDRNTDRLSLFEPTQADFDVLPEFKDVVELHVSRPSDDVRDPLAAIAQLPNLQKLELALNWRDDWPTSSLRHLPLKYLRVYSPGFYAEDLAGLDLPPSLEVLDLRRVSTINEDAIVELGKLQNLKRLYLGSTGISKQSVPELQSCLPDCKVYMWDGGPMHKPEDDGPAY
ncbi:MAG: hypothetical protein KDB32_05125 [Planctomycetes bacterium]|nr:hypothetical protein [Planctomycetota bacterium]MCA8947153.1 hypothetical protein [Planctomycetota bacterium]